MYSSSPSLFHFTTSPVLYTLSPSSLPTLRHTNFSAVSPASASYPLATPSPPTYNSPFTPSGNSSCILPSTYTLVLLTASPIATLLPTSSPLLITFRLVNVVFSVGPYPFITSSTPPLSSNPFTLSALTTSPPVTTCLTPFNRSACLSTI